MARRFGPDRHRSDPELRQRCRTAEEHRGSRCLPAEPASDSVSPEAPTRQPGGTAPSQQARDHQAETGRILENLRKRRHSEEEPRTRLRAVTEDPETHPQGAHTAPGQPAAATDDEV